MGLKSTFNPDQTVYLFESCFVQVAYATALDVFIIICSILVFFALAEFALLSFLDVYIRKEIYSDSIDKVLVQVQPQLRCLICLILEVSNLISHQAVQREGAEESRAAETHQDTEESQGDGEQLLLGEKIISSL